MERLLSSSWLSVFQMLQTLGLVRGRRKRRPLRLPMPGADR